MAAIAFLLPGGSAGALAVVDGGYTFTGLAGSGFPFRVDFPTLSGDGKTLVFVGTDVTDNGNQGLHIDTTSGLFVSSGDFKQALRIGTDPSLWPAISHDGRYVAYSGWNGTASDLYVYDTVTAVTTRLTDTGMDPLGVSISGNGEWIVFGARDATGTMRSVYRFSRDGSVRGALATGTSQEMWACSTDYASSRVIFVAASNVMMVDTESLAITQLTSFTGNIGVMSAFLSEDGSRVTAVTQALYGDPSFTDRLWSFPTDGGAPYEFAVPTGNQLGWYRPSTTADGAVIFIQTIPPFPSSSNFQSGFRRWGSAILEFSLADGSARYIFQSQLGVGLPSTSFEGRVVAFASGAVGRLVLGVSQIQG